MGISLMTEPRIQAVHDFEHGARIIEGSLESQHQAGGLKVEGHKIRSTLDAFNRIHLNHVGFIMGFKITFEVLVATTRSTGAVDFDDFCLLPWHQTHFSCQIEIAGG